MGVRYNAQKTKVGMYFTTPIHQFRMKCHLCDQHFEIRTDPKNLDYVILSGAKRKEERWDMGENEQIVTDGIIFINIFLIILNQNFDDVCFLRSQ